MVQGNRLVPWRRRTFIISVNHKIYQSAIMSDDGIASSLSARAADLNLPRPIGLAVGCLSLLALGIAIYLLATSLIESGQPWGCGGTSGCGEVLSSRWSQVAGLPVSLLAIAAYGLLLAVVVAMPRSSDSRRHWLWVVAVACAMSILLAAIWFSSVQILLLNAICPWCMAEHLIGLAIAVLVLGSAVRLTRQGRTPRLLPARFAAASLVGSLGVAALVGLQQFGEFSGPSALRGSPSATDRDQRSESGREISLLDGALRFQLPQMPLLGNPQADHVLVLLFDYCCPHCRTTHEYLLQFMQEYPQPVAVVTLPMPLDAKCNSYRTSTDKRFEESCQLARLALAVHRVNADAFAEFDRWMFESSRPRRYADAKRQAAQLVDARELELTLQNDSWIDDVIDMDVEAYHQVGAEYLPVILSPGFASIIGRPGSYTELADTLRKEFNWTSH